MTYGSKGDRQVSYQREQENSRGPPFVAGAGEGAVPGRLTGAGRDRPPRRRSPAGHGMPQQELPHAPLPRVTPPDDGVGRRLGEGDGHRPPEAGTAGQRGNLSQKRPHGRLTAPQPPGGHQCRRGVRRHRPSVGSVLRHHGRRHGAGCTRRGGPGVKGRGVEEHVQADLDRGHGGADPGQRPLVARERAAQGEDRGEGDALGPQGRGRMSREAVSGRRERHAHRGEDGGPQAP